MKISTTAYEQEILKELGNRIKQYRISLNITQIDLANKCGISSSTEIRIENGEDSKISNYIKILIGLGLSENLNILIPEAQPDFKALYEQKPKRQRATPSAQKSGSKWVWGEDK